MMYINVMYANKYCSKTPTDNVLLYALSCESNLDKDSQILDVRSSFMLALIHIGKC